MWESRTTEVTVGLFVALGIAALMVLALRVSDFSTAGSGEGYAISAKFSNIGGLKVRAPVKMAGVRVGKVADIRFDSDSYEAVVTMRIDGQYDRIPLDTTANIYTAGLLGEQYVALEAGGDFEFVGEGDELPLTQSAVVLEQVIGQVLYSQGEDD
jgi:phospholipid/cholesterol/gamma-HCH transport system substrate-binding protein